MIRKSILIIVILQIICPIALCGVFANCFMGGYNLNTNDDKRMAINFSNHDIIAGVDMRANLETSLQSRFEGIPPVPIADLKASQIVGDGVYYSRLTSEVVHKVYTMGQDPVVKTVDVDTYIIMPKKFDAIQAMTMHFSDEDSSQAELTAKFTYDNEEYEFTVTSEIDETNELEIFLAPYCPLLEGLDLDYTDSFPDSISRDNLHYEGGLTIEAIKV